MQAGLIFVVIGYLSGSIPFSYLMGLAIGGKDIRKEGSGNVGATNVLRVAGKKAGVAAAAGDILKSLAPVAAARLAGLEPAWVAMTAAAVIIGHCFPVWLRFRGGKGVNSAVAVFTVMFWPAALAFGIVWMLCFRLTRWVSLSSLLGAATIPVAVALFGGERSTLVLGLWSAVFIAYRHRSNVRRLLAGTEPRMGEGR